MSRRSPNGRPYVSIRTYAPIEAATWTHKPLPATLTAIELALEIEPGTLGKVLASASHGLDPASLPHYLVKFENGQLVGRTYMPEQQETAPETVLETVDAAASRPS